MAKQEDYVRYTVRIPAHVYETIKQAAGEKSVNAEIIARLSGGGKTLRDEFAMAALAGFLAGEGGLQRPADEVAGWAYNYADFMCDARGKIVP